MGKGENEGEVGLRKVKQKGLRLNSYVNGVNVKEKKKDVPYHFLFFFWVGEKSIL